MTESHHDELIKMLARRYTEGVAGYTDQWIKMLEPMSAHLLDFLPLAEANRILDVGCGPGTVTRNLRQLAGSATIVGVDRSRGMLARAPTLPKAAWCLMDGRRLAFAGGSFGAAILAFVLFHFPDMSAALRDIGRVLRPGGFLGTATFHTTPTFEAQRIWQESMANLSPPGTPSTTDLSVVNCVKQTDRPEKLSVLLEAAGFRSIRTVQEQFEYEWNPADYLALRTSFGSSGAAYRSLNQASRDELLALIRQRFTRLPREAFRFTPTVLYATARQPA